MNEIGMKMKIDTKRLPFYITKTKEGYLVKSHEAEVTGYWGDTPEEAIVEYWNKRISKWKQDSEDLYKLRILLGVQI